MGVWRKRLAAACVVIVVGTLVWYICLPYIMWCRLDKSAGKMVEGFAQMDILAVMDELYEYYEPKVVQEHYESITYGVRLFTGYEMECIEHAMRQEGELVIYRAKYCLTTKAGTTEMYAEMAFGASGLFNVVIGGVEMEIYEPDLNGIVLPETILPFILIFPVLYLLTLILLIVFSDEFMARFGKKRKGKGCAIGRGKSERVFTLEDADRPSIEESDEIKWSYGGGYVFGKHYRAQSNLIGKPVWIIVMCALLVGLPLLIAADLFDFWGDYRWFKRLWEVFWN